MVMFRVCLNLNNFDELYKPYMMKNEKKLEKIVSFYKHLAKMIVSFHNDDIRQTRAIFEDYYEPYIKLKKNIFVTHSLNYDQDSEYKNDHIESLVQSLYPPLIELDFEFKIQIHLEKKGLKEFTEKLRKENIHVKGKDIRSMYYSTKITNFITNLNVLLIDNNFWKIFLKESGIKTKYTPDITVEDTIVISLN